MALKEEFEATGNWFFRWRSYLPLIILPVLLIALRESEYFERTVSHFAEELWEIPCLMLSFVGLIIRSFVVAYTPRGTSRRNTRGQKAEILNTTGMYSIVRHPLYLGNFFIFSGVVLFTQVWWFIIFAVLSFWLYYERIMFAEEEFLRKKFGENFEKWSKKPPAFIPNFKNWNQPDLSFSFKNILKREYTAFFLIILCFGLLDFTGNIFAEGKFKIDSFWLISSVIGLVVYVILRTLKKKTNILKVEGR